MKEGFKGALIFLLTIGCLLGMSYGFGWIGVHQTKTIFKAKENAKREVFEQTQSYVEGKRQEALKLYREYNKADESDKQTIKEIIVHSFSNFDENKLPYELQIFIHDCKYN